MKTAGFERVSNECRKTNWQYQITTRANSAMNQSEFLAITCNLLKAREKSRVRGVIGFGFASHWLKTGARFLSQSLSVTIVASPIT